MGVAVFDYDEWSQRYPALAANVDQDLASFYFIEGGLLYLDNTDASVVQDVPTRTLLLYLLTAHIATLNLPVSAGGNGAGGVGRTSSASRGSVSVSFDMGPTTASSAWFMQTQYGAMFWQAMLPYRTARYVNVPYVERQTYP